MATMSVEPEEQAPAIDPEGADSRPKYIADPEGWLRETRLAHEYVCLVIFRGSWCKFDHHYLTQLGKVNLESMRPDGPVHLVAWTSEGPDGARRADERWGLTKDWGYSAVIGDSSCALARYLKEDEILPALAFSKVEDAQVEKLVPKTSTYPKGMVQPALLFFAHHGDLALQWAARVKKPHFGAADRPLPSECWRRVQKRKEALDLGEEVIPVNGAKLKTCTHAGDVNCAIM